MDLNSRSDYLMAIASILFAQLMLIWSMGALMFTLAHFDVDWTVYGEYSTLLFAGYLMINGAAVALLGRLHLKLKRAREMQSESAKSTAT